MTLMIAQEVELDVFMDIGQNLTRFNFFYSKNIAKTFFQGW